MQTVTPRPYQQRIFDALIDAINRGIPSACASVSTGGGKSLIIAMLAKRLLDRGHLVAVTVHTRELIRQLEKTCLWLMEREDVGVTATGLGRDDPIRRLQIAQIQTIGRRPRALGPRRVLIVDEAHLIPPDGEGQYRTLINEMRVMQPDMRVLGVTATPMRMGSGLIYGPGKMFDECVGRIGMRELISEGFLCPVIGKTGDRTIDTTKLHTRLGEFIPAEVDALMMDTNRVATAVAHMMAHTTDRSQILVFSSNLRHSEMLRAEISKYDPRVATVDGTMPTAQRDGILKQFHDRQIRFVVNANVLTVGFDEPGIDCIATFRPTASATLLLQSAGRGLRTDARKENCLFLDFAQNLERHGPLDTIEDNIAEKKKGAKGVAPTKVCECGCVLPASAIVCNACGKEFPRLLKHDERPSDAAVTSDTPITYEISRIYARRHQKKGQPMTLRLDYCDKIGMPVASEWLSISPEANAYAYAKSIKALEKWPESPFRRVGDTLYKLGTTGQLDKLDTDGIVEHAARLKAPLRITTVRDGKYVRITKKDFTYV